MSSYADIASKGPAQPDEEVIPQAIPEIAHDESATIHDPLHGHPDVKTISYADQQLQAERTASARRESEKKANEISKEARDFMESATASEAKLTGSSSSRSGAMKDLEQTADKAEKNAKQTADKTEKDLKQAADKAEKKYQEVKGQAIDEYEEIKGKAIDQYENNVKPAVHDGVEKGKKEGKKAEQWADKNKDNPVVVGNAIALAVLGGVLSIGAYRMHSQGRLTGQVVAATAGALALFGLGDYYVSQFFFKKYPPKN